MYATGMVGVPFFLVFFLATRLPGEALAKATAQLRRLSRPSQGLANILDQHPGLHPGLRSATDGAGVVAQASAWCPGAEKLQSALLQFSGHGARATPTSTRHSSRAIALVPPWCNNDTIACLQTPGTPFASLRVKEHSAAPRCLRQGADKGWGKLLATGQPNPIAQRAPGF